MLSENDFQSWLTPQEAALALFVRPEHVYSWIRSGELPAVNVALDKDGERPRWRISRVAVQNFLFDREAGLRGYVRR
jgi:excisionase family DNA binding protein